MLAVFVANGFFSHGLSYTTFDLSDLTVSEPQFTNGDVSITATVKVTNTGSVAGTEVVQLYVSLPTTFELTHPPLMLKAFAKVVDLAPGKSTTVSLKLDKYAVAYWDEREDSWVVAPGKYGVHVGFSSEELLVQTEVEVKERLKWRGL